jgi:hypothetical protein
LRAFRDAEGLFVNLDHTVANWHIGTLVQKMSDQTAFDILRLLGMQVKKADAKSFLRGSIFFQGQGADGKVTLRQDAGGLFSSPSMASPELAAINAEITKKLAGGDAAGAMDALRRKQALLDGDAVLKNRAVTPYLIDNNKLMNLEDPAQSHIDSLVLEATSRFDEEGNPMISLDALKGLMAAQKSGDMTRLLEITDAAQIERDELFGNAGYEYVMDQNGNISVVGNSTPKRLDETLTKVGFSKTDGSIPDAPTSSELGLFLALGEGEKVDIDSLGLQQRMLQAGAPAPIAKVVSFFSKKGKGSLSDEAFGKIRKFSLIQFGGQAERLRRVGATWLADIIEPNNAAGFEATLGAKMAADLERMINMMDEVSNLSGFGKRTLHAIKRDMQVFGEAAHHIPQTTAEQALIDAMRKGDAAVAKLPKELRAVAVEWRKKAAELLERQKEAGIGMGDITTLDNSFYLPQRLNVSWIAANSEEAVKRFARWMAKDSGDSIELTTARARRVVLEAISREDLDGMLSATSNVYADSFGGKLFARQFNIDPEDWDFLSPMFDNNLRSLMVGYVKNTNRAIESAKSVGVGSHALRTYTDVGARGYQAALDALMGKAADLTYVPKQDSAEAVEMTSSLFSPLFRDVRQAAEAVDRIIGAIQRDGPVAANAQIEILSRLYESTGQAGSEHFAKRAEAIVHGLIDFGKDGSEISARELKFMANVGKLMNGKAVHKIDLPRGGQRLASGLKTFNSVTLLSMSVLSSISDMGGSLMRTGDFNAYVKGVAGKMKAMAGDPDYRSSLLNIGAGIESILQENIAGSVGGASGRISNAFFNGIGLTQWTRANRDVAALVAFESIRNNTEIAKRLRAAGQQDTVKYRRAVRHLREVGLAKLIDEPALENIAQATAREDISAAIHKIANESVFQPNRMDVPVWAQDPLLSLLWQFKSYPQQMFKAVKRNISEAFAKEDGKYAGDLRPIMFLLTTGAALGAGGMALKDVVTGRNDVEGNSPEDWRTFRERRLSKMVQEFGFKDFEMDNETLDTFAGWYVEALLSLGTLGFVGDLAFQTARSVDDGAFGRERVMSQIAGPWLGTFTDALKVADGLSKVAVEQITGVEDEANADQRNAVRAVLGRVPVMGSQRPIVNPIVDYVAGERQAP